MDTYNPLGSPLLDPDGTRRPPTPAARHSNAISEFERFERLSRELVEAPPRGEPNEESREVD